MSARCGRCERDPAAGFATIGDERFCHPVDGVGRSCYTNESFDRTFAIDTAALSARLIEEAEA